MNTAANDPSWKILIVEDEALLAEELRDRLTALGHQIVGVVDTGADAINEARALKPDLIWMDIRIKGPINGIQTGDQIYNELGIPVVFASAHSDRDTLQQAQIQGQFGYIIKPFREQDIVMAIRLAMHRHYAEADLQKTHLTYSAILSNITDSVIVTTADGKVRFMNAAAEELTGWRIDDARDQPIDAITFLRHEDGKPALIKDIAPTDVNITATWEGTPFLLKNRIGMEANVKVAVTPVRGRSTDTLGMAVLIRNTTDHRSVDMCIQHLINASPDAVIVSDEMGRISLASQRAESAFGYTREELHGKPLEMLVPERFRSHYFSLRDRHLTDPSVRQLDGLYNVYGLRKDGSEFPMEMTVSSAKTTEGLSTFFVIKNLASRREDDGTAWNFESFDALTGLPNRNQFSERLAWSIAHVAVGKTVTLLVVDIDDFKTATQALSADVRDRLVRAIAHQIQKAVRTKDAVARIAESTFAVLVPNLYDLRVADRMAQRLVQKLSAPFNAGIQPIQLTASVGIAAHPQDAQTSEALLASAMEAIQIAKHKGGNRFAHFSPTRQTEADKWRALLDDLDGALERGEFVIHYQPLFKLSTAKPTKAEAVLRWNHPQRGVISPFEFLPLLEESGLIHKIGEWMFDEVTTYAARLEKKMGRIIQLGINLSSMQFASWEDGPVNWSAKLAALPEQKKRIAVIIRENALVDQPQLAQKHLPEFRAHGIDISIDGFGTRFSSLSHLKLFAFDYLRIDASFIKNITRDENDRALAEAITIIAHDLGAQAIAKGVDTQEQRQILLNIGCDYGQGALFSPTLSPDNLELSLLRGGAKEKRQSNVTR